MCCCLAHRYLSLPPNRLRIIMVHRYSEKDVFVRELISNAADALEKLRYLQNSQDAISDAEVPLGINLFVDKESKTFTIQVPTNDNLPAMAYMYATAVEDPPALCLPSAVLQCWWRCNVATVELGQMVYTFSHID